MMSTVYSWEQAPEQVLTKFTECMKSQQCAPLKHHYDECAERVTQQQEENGKADEDCVEECMLKPTPDHCQHVWELLASCSEEYKHILTYDSLPPHALRIRLRRS